MNHYRHSHQPQRWKKDRSALWDDATTGYDRTGDIVGRRLAFVRKMIIVIVTIVIKVEDYVVVDKVPGSTTGIVIGVGIRIVNCRAQSRISFYCCVDHLRVRVRDVAPLVSREGSLQYYYLVVFLLLIVDTLIRGGMNTVKSFDTYLIF